MTYIGGGVTAVDCQKQVRSWRLLRSLMQLLIPTCNCTFQQDEQQNITGTLLGSRKGRVSFCIQADANSTAPILLLEFSIPTSVLAKEMRGGTLRIVLETAATTTTTSLFSTPLWTMHCNGRKVGYAVKRSRPSNADFEALTLIRSVDVGTGVLNYHDHEVMYLRANFQRVRGAGGCESFHLIDPEGSIGQELSIFFISSTSVKR